MSRLNKFAGFLGHYSKELTLMASVFRSLGSRFLDHDDQAKIAEVVERFENSAKTILDTLDEVKEATSVKISPADVKKAVKEAMPELIADAVANALRDQANAFEDRLKALEEREG